MRSSLLCLIASVGLLHSGQAIAQTENAHQGLANTGKSESGVLSTISIGARKAAGIAGWVLDKLLGDPKLDAIVAQARAIEAQARAQETAVLAMRTAGAEPNTAMMRSLEAQNAELNRQVEELRTQLRGEGIDLNWITVEVCDQLGCRKFEPVGPPVINPGVSGLERERALGKRESSARPSNGSKSAK